MLWTASLGPLLSADTRSQTVMIAPQSSEVRFSSVAWAIGSGIIVRIYYIGSGWKYQGKSIGSHHIPTTSSKGPAAAARNMMREEDVMYRGFVYSSVAQWAR